MTLRVIAAETENSAGNPEDKLSLDQAGALLDRAAEATLETLSRMERRDLQTFSAIETFAIVLKSVSHHLAHVRQGVQIANSQNGPKLDGMAARLAEIETRLSSVADAKPGPAFDFTPMMAALDTIGRRLAGLESKLDAPPPQFDTAAVTDSLAAIADRLARVEAKLDNVAQQPVLEPETTSALLGTIAQRVSQVEDKVHSGADGTSIAACLLAVDRRLSRIEGGLGMGLPMPAAEDIPDLTDVVQIDQPMPAPEQAPLPAAAADTPPPLPDLGEPAPRERVDQLLEQVFRVLAR